MRSMSRATTAGQMTLPLNAKQIKDLDRKQRRVVLAVLARLLLEAAGATSARREGDDDPA
jgi:hypothetical protein